MIYFGKMDIICLISVQLSGFKIHWKHKRKIYNFIEDTKTQFECSEAKTRTNISYLVYYLRTIPLTTTYQFDGTLLQILKTKGRDSWEKLSSSISPNGFIPCGIRATLFEGGINPLFSGIFLYSCDLPSIVLPIGFEFVLNGSFDELYGKEYTLPPTASPPLPLPVGFCWEYLGHWQATADGRFNTTVAGRHRASKDDDEYLEFNCSSQFLLLIESRVCVLDSANFSSSTLCCWGFEVFVASRFYSSIQERALISQYSLIMSTDGSISTHSYREGTSEPSMMQVTETAQSLQQIVEGLARQYQSVARDIEELKKGKSSPTVEQRVGDNLSGFNSPHHQRPFDSAST
ncbi:hypothetical protein M9H77_17759 [Catharanthus roseus]|uniref:Uncharacterized protein n=1 Tax=Catharanthus roseus TaxID=4058 RepID=A0ACC0B5H8_CATRO|nr:hypothetical protein M9H77_17759 [Catharanthus roseus]